jgi:glutamate synthase domain-containing protein 2
VQSVAVLIGYGAAAVNPYLMLATVGPDGEDKAIGAIGKGLLKTISKMGISTLSSYCGAQVFEAVGLSAELVERHFTGTPSRIGGIGLRELAEGALVRHARAYPASAEELLPVVGLYAWRRGARRCAACCDSRSATRSRSRRSSRRRRS